MNSTLDKLQSGRARQLARSSRRRRRPSRRRPRATSPAPTDGREALKRAPVSPQVASTNDAIVGALNDAADAWAQGRDGAADADRGEYRRASRRSRRPRRSSADRRSRRADPALRSSVRACAPLRTPPPYYDPHDYYVVGQDDKPPYLHQPERENPQAITGFSFGISALGLFVLSGGISFLVSIPCSIVAMVVGRRGMKAVDDGPRHQAPALRQGGLRDRARHALPGRRSWASR